MQVGQLLRSASFRLTTAYVALFSISVSILASLIYFSTTAELQHEIRTRIQVDSVALGAEYARGGTSQLMQAMADRQRGHLVGGLDYTLYGSGGKLLFGKLPSTACRRGWVTFVGPPDGDEPPGEMEKLAVLVTPLAGGECLLVGDDIGKVRKFGSLILGSFGWVFLLTVTMAVAGGIFLSSRFLRRIEAINRTAEAIIEGDINRRIPRRGAPDDLDRLASTLNRMLDRTTSLMDSLRHVSNDLAHDLRTPLGRLRNTLENAKESISSPEDYRAVLDRAVFEVDGILDTFGAILRIAQIESGSRRSGFQRLSLSELVCDVCETFAPSMEDAGKTFLTDIQPGLYVQGDRELLVQSLVNILENAITHTAAGVRVIVSLKRSWRGVELSISDNGAGVPDAECENIFKRFYRLERSRSAAGNGLGLSIVAAVAELHGAKISSSSSNPGLKVTLLFSPVREAA